MNSRIVSSLLLILILHCMAFPARSEEGLDEVDAERMRIARCLKPHQTFQLPNAKDGQYFRVAKDLSWVVGTLAGKSRFWRRQKDGRYVENASPLMVEPFPVEPCQKLMASPQHPDGMHFYETKALGQSGVKQKSLMTDGELDGFYGSFGGKCDGKQATFRSLLWNGLRSRTCTYDFATKKSNCGPIFPLCYNLVPPLGLTQLEFHRLDSVWRYLASLGKAERWDEKDLDSLPPTKRAEFGYGPKENIHKAFIDLKKRVHDLEVDHGLNRPILAKDGDTLMAYSQERLSMFKIHEDGTCEKVELSKKLNFGGNMGKPTGSYATHEGLPRYIVYVDSMPYYQGKLLSLIDVHASNVSVYDTKRKMALGLPVYPSVGKPNMASELFSYASFTENDQVVVFDREGTGYIIDPENAFQCYLGNPLLKHDADEATKSTN